MTVEAELLRRNITELLHFTTNRGVTGTLAQGALLSRYRLPSESYLQHVLHVNSETRPEASYFFDKSDNWLDYVNLSISEINRRFFLVSQRWHSQSEVWWAILSFDPVIATHENVVFATTNNSYDYCVRAKGQEGFDRLFASSIRRKPPSWVAIRGAREDRLPTCEQAEVLYPGQVPVTFLRKIYVFEDDHHDLAVGMLHFFGHAGVEVVVSPSKFVGRLN